MNSEKHGKPNNVNTNNNNNVNILLSYTEYIQQQPGIFCLYHSFRHRLLQFLN